MAESFSFNKSFNVTQQIAREDILNELDMLEEWWMTEKYNKFVIINQKGKEKGKDQRTDGGILYTRT